MGLPTAAGKVFRGQAGANRFFIPVATPVWRDNVRAKLARVGIKFAADPGVTITGLSIADGARTRPFGFPPMALGGDHSLSWDENVNYFDDANPKEVESCVCLIVDTRFNTEGNFTLCCVGCDFLV